MKKLLTLAILLMTINLVNAQGSEFEKAPIPIKEIADSTILKTIDWLIHTPLEKDPIKRSDSQNFLLNWVVATEKVTVKVDFKVVNFIEKNPDLLYYFLCGWVDYAYKNNLKVEELDANVAAVTTVVDFYNKNKRMFARDKNIEAYDKLIKKGTLKENLRKKIENKSLGEAWKELNQ